MSIVAAKIYDDKISIASDSIIVYGSTQSKSADKFAKLFQVDDMFVGSVGICEESALLQVFCKTHTPERADESSYINFLAEFAEWKNDKIGDPKIVNDYLIVYQKKLFHIQGFFVYEIAGHSAIGAGRDFALAALHMGSSVSKAVEVACELSVYCELPVKEYTIKL